MSYLDVDKWFFSILLLVIASNMSAVPKGYVVDLQNKRINRLNLDLGIAFSDQKKIRSGTIHLRYVGPADHGVIEGEVHDCRIGQTKVPESAVQIKLNNSKSIGTREAQKPFQIYLVLTNSRRLTGAVECQYMSLRLTD